MMVRIRIQLMIKENIKDGVTEHTYSFANLVFCRGKPVLKVFRGNIGSNRTFLALLLCSLTENYFQTFVGTF